jgi:catechol 2,3-dioxygenase-like lactoylglutathione lyase family enzyme
MSRTTPPLRPRVEGAHPGAESKGGSVVDWTLELVLVPVSDVDRAKTFYMEKAGFNLNVDHSAGEDFRVVQLTPPGSACSIAIMRNTETAGSAQGLHLVVADIEAARAELVERGTDTSDFFHFEEGGQTSGLDPQRIDYGSFLSFSDPDGNGWLVQEVARARSGS